MQDEYLTRCVVDVSKKSFYLMSSEGDDKLVECETIDQFMNILELCRATLDEDTLVYSNPLNKIKLFP